MPRPKKSAPKAAEPPPPPAAPEPKPVRVWKYGIRSDVFGIPPDMELRVDELESLAFLYSDRLPESLGKYQHLKRLIQLKWPTVQWNPWLEEQLASLCNDDYAIKRGNVTVRAVEWTGCGSAGKSYATGLYAMAWFYACRIEAPFDALVILTSTTKDMISKRVWPAIQWCMQESCDASTGKRAKLPFHMIESQKKVQFQKGDDKHSIACLAVRDGETANAVENLKGQHARRMMIVIDEANKTPEAIFQTFPNMLTATMDITFVIIGNAVSKLDNHGRACEPRLGWSSVGVSNLSWPTKGVKEWQLPPGVCLHFDGYKSPNVAAGKTVWPFLYTYESYRNSVELGLVNTINHWSQARGFWAPDGFCKTIFSESMVEKYDMAGRIHFVGPTMAVASVDTAFGGDKCVFTPGKVGMIAGNRLALQIEQPIYINPRADAAHELDYQIARQIMAECKARGISPQHIAIDATGIGRGVAAILEGEYGLVHRVESGGRPTELPSGQADHRPAVEVYDRRVTELWYSMHDFVVAGQVKGFDREAIEQLCAREYEMAGRKYKLQPKDAFKEAFGRSPDEADAASYLVDLLRHLGAVAGTSWNTREDEVTKQTAKDYDQAYDQNAPGQNNEAEELLALENEMGYGASRAAESNVYDTF